MFAVITFLALNALIAGLTWWRGRAAHGGDEFFLGRRRLTAPLVALSLLMTNFSTEQLVGLNGAAFQNGISTMAWEVFGALGLAAFAAVFLPRYYARGVTTIPQYVERRCGAPTRRLMSLLMVLSLCLVGVPFVLYSGVLPMMAIFDLPGLLGLPEPQVRLLTAAVLGAAGLAYALVGGMRSVALSDLCFAALFFVVALLVPWLGLLRLGGGDFLTGLTRLVEARPEAFDPFAGPGVPLPASALLTGMLVINLSAWCANQGSAQKAFAGASLAESQKGVLLAALVKLAAPVFFVLPGLIAWALLDGRIEQPDQCYAWLVRTLLPHWLAGFLAAAIAGATITSVSGFVHSATSLVTLDLLEDRDASTAGRLPRSGVWFGVAVVILAVLATPLIAGHADGFFVLMKRINVALTIPVVSVTAVAVLTRLEWRGGWVPATMGLASGAYLFCDLVLAEAAASFVRLHWLHSVGIAFGFAVCLLAAGGRKGAGEAAPVAAGLGAGAMEGAAGWRPTRLLSCLVAAAVAALYGGLYASRALGLF